MGSTESPYLVAAIDFGTTHSSYAFSYRHDYEKDPQNITTTVWPGNMDLYTPKAPTVVLLDENLQFVAFGYEAQDVYADKFTDQEHEEYRMFQHFTLPLCNYNLDVTTEWMIPDTHDVEVPAVKVISEVLKYYQRHLQNTIVKHTGHNEDHPVRWVIVVPATWNDSARQLMIAAAALAGFDSDHLFLADAPEMAILHSKHIKPSNSVMARGDRVMVVDLGGGGMEMCVYRVASNTELDIIMKEYHNNLGSRILNDLLIVFLSDLFNVDFEEFQAALNTNQIEYLELLRSFEATKRLVGDDGLKPITLKLPLGFKDHIFELSGLTLEEAITAVDLQSSVSIVKGNLRMDRQIFNMIFADMINQIINVVTRIVKDFSGNNSPITHMIFTGGFSECKLFQSEIKQKHSKLLIPSDSGLALLKGAVIYGHDLESIKCMNTVDNNVVSFEEFVALSRSGDELSNDTADSISAFQVLIRSRLNALQEEYDEEFHRLCGMEPGAHSDQEMLSCDDETGNQEERETTFESQEGAYSDIQRETTEEIRKQHEAELQKEREAEMQRQREAELQRQRELETQRQRELETQRQREEELRRQRAAEAQRQQEMEEQRKREAEEQRLRAIEHQRGLAEAAERRRREQEKKQKKSSVCTLL